MIPKGRYVMQALPESTGWTLILQAETTGAANIMVMTHDPAKDFARIPLTASSVADAQESLTIALVPSTADGNARGVLQIAWDRTRLSAEWATR
jgi:hypothetical protein